MTIQRGGGPSNAIHDIHAVAKLIGESPPFLALLDRLPQVAAADATVLIEGETGTGKELVGRAIHYLSPRSAMPFVPVNCGALPDSLLEDELFGHERGAFTDAQRDRCGLIRAAEGGTLCLDEVGSLSSRAQVALLRVLQDKTFRMLGSVREIRADTRFIAMSNTPLAELVRRGTFRADLYYRLCVLSVRLPPLRDRRTDILRLAFHFLRKHARAEHPVTDIAPAACRVLEACDWPGNVRELENTMHRAAQMARARRVEVEDLELPNAADAGADEQPAPGSGPLNFNTLKQQAIRIFERSYLTQLMERCRGNVTHAARLAGKERRDLGRLLKKHQILPGAYAGE
jgi:DNA-binding NtrC family response regulator